MHSVIMVIIHILILKPSNYNRSQRILVSDIRVECKIFKMIKKIYTLQSSAINYSTFYCLS